MGGGAHWRNSRILAGQLFVPELYTDLGLLLIISIGLVSAVGVAIGSGSRRQVLPAGYAFEAAITLESLNRGSHTSS